VTCDGRLFHHRRAAATGNALSPTVDSRMRRTPRDVDEAECRYRKRQMCIIVYFQNWVIVLGRTATVQRHSSLSSAAAESASAFSQVSLNLLQLLLIVFLLGSFLTDLFVFCTMVG